MQSGPFVLFFSGGPALTIYPARAVGCLSGKYGVVCAMGLRARIRMGSIIIS